MGLLVLTNSVDHNYQWELAKKLVDDMVAKKLIEKKYSAEHLAWKTIIATNNELPLYQPSDPDNFTPYKPEWKKYTGIYSPLFDWNLTLEARIGYKLGTYRIDSFSVHENEGYLKVNGKRLDEYQPGVFFTKDGDCLDFSGSLPIWNGLRLKKEKNKK